MDRSLVILGLVAVLLSGCATSSRNGYSGTARPLTEVATIQTVGAPQQFAMGADRDIPTPFVEAVNGLVVGGYGYSAMGPAYVRTVHALPGVAKLRIYCTVPPGTPGANERRVDFGVAVTPVSYFDLELSANLEAGKKYALRCGKRSGDTFEAWLEGPLAAGS